MLFILVLEMKLCKEGSLIIRELSPCQWVVAGEAFPQNLSKVLGEWRTFSLGPWASREARLAGLRTHSWRYTVRMDL